MSQFTRLSRWFATQVGSRGGLAQATPEQPAALERARLGEERERLRFDREKLDEERRQLQSEKSFWQAAHWVPPGHYYSPLPCVDEARRSRERIFERIPDALPGVDLNDAGQAELFVRMAPFLREVPFSREKIAGRRYYSENGWYPMGDAAFLYALMRLHRPRRIIEIGSGWSSCAILDTNELHFDNAIRCTFVEPDPGRLLQAIEPKDRGHIDLVQQPIQDVDLKLFGELSGGDILLIDSSHVAKIGSDVNHLLFEVLPALRAGVKVHFHDIWYPFEYPEAWVYEGRAWNENYFLRAFLQYNIHFAVHFFVSYFCRFHKQAVIGALPCLGSQPMGNSLWLDRAVQ